MFVSKLLSVVALVAGSSAFPTFGFSAAKESSTASSVFESIDNPPSGWVKENVEFDKDEATIALRIQLVHQDMNKFHELATNIATPGHELYGKHVSQDVIDSIIAPKDESKDLVLGWLRNQSLADSATVSPRGNTIILEASVSQLEKLLKTQYDVYSNAESGEEVVRTLEYSLPNNLKGHVSMVQPTTFFGLRAMRSSISRIHDVPESEALDTHEDAALAGCSGSYVTPACLASLYNFASATGSQTAGRMGIAGFLAQYPVKSDLATFLKKFAITGNTAETYTCALVNGGTCPTSPASPGVEANLDVQYARAITKDIPNVFYSTAGKPPIVGSGTNTNEPYLELLDYLIGLDDSELPNTLSISYGDDESTVPLSYADNVCNLFSQIGARGVSVTVSSGDSGVGTTCKVGGKSQFTTAFPAACPWVTTVGGTSGTTTESAWTSGGGGFSEVFGRPSYQETAVSSWLSANKDGVSAYFNASGRAYPDVAAQATNFEIVVSGSTEAVDGTSCASPTFASIIQLINSERVAAGKSGLGFLNPWLYSTASTALNDIAKGSITGCRGVITGAKFSAITGWDPATGLGTPNYAKLLAASNAS
ncbi:peptidase S8/S53 domain-containing protein [Xylariales sp. AK1849]|nr:peptidase S8/S53 domain-containing protein [Xylariales sp. AK1849]